MAQTWPPTKRKLALVGAIDLVGRPLARVVRPAVAAESRAGQTSTTPERILVVELWQIGDVVLATPLLSALRSCFPQAHITLLGKPHAEILLQGSGLVDEVIVAELPWTRPERKYRPADYDWRTLRQLARTLRSHRFDVAFDARMDIRSNILVALSGSRRRVGFRYGGGDWLLTDAVPVDPPANHKVTDWLSLLHAVGCDLREEPRCTLVATEDERMTARQLISNRFGVARSPVAIHPGGSHPGKRWPLERFLALAGELIAGGHQVVAFEEPSGYGRELGEVSGVLAVRVDLRELMATLEQCVTLVCNDSGPMHVAAALGVPTVAIFERGQPQWFGPVGEGHIVIRGERAGIDVSAAPVGMPPSNPVSVELVKEAVLTQISGAAAR